MARGGEDLRTRLLATFRPEAREHLEAIGGHLLALERGPAEEAARAALEEVFRSFHTLKGAARSVGLAEVEALAQACETSLRGLTRGEARPTRALIQALRRAAQGIGALVESGAAGADASALAQEVADAERRGPEPPAPAEDASAPPFAGALEAATAPPATAAPAAGALAPDTLRVGTAKLDALLVRAEDFVGPKLAAAERGSSARALADILAGCRRAVGRLDATPDARAAGPLRDALAAVAGELRAAEARARALEGHLARDARSLAGAVDALEHEARSLRMSPAASILAAFPGMVRDLAESQGKEVDWSAEGASVEVDRKVLEAAKAPLLHLVRNAVDHGIEPPAERERAGKPRRGTVRLSVATVEGGRVEIRVEDDGRGIDAARVRAAAARLRLLTAEQAEALGDEEALDLVFRSGLSTSPVITAISGHGLGLAIVREGVERLGGRLRLENRPGAGTSVRMTLPATIATFTGLLVRAGGPLFLLPTEAVERVVRARADQVRRVEGREVLEWDGRTLLLARLAAVLGLDEAGGNGAARSCVILGAEGQRTALAVDEVLGNREVVVKEFRAPLVRARHVSGAGLLATGELALILRPGDLARHAEAAARPGPVAPKAPEERPSTVLVVDDSITTRTMEKNLLEAAGYHVQVAVDGAEAWTALKTQSFDVVVSDVDMPRMDGFELTQRIRADRRLAELPVVLVTALESREDKERGIEVGANAYVVKSSFEQSNLLEILRRLA